MYRGILKCMNSLSNSHVEAVNQRDQLTSSNPYQLRLNSLSQKREFRI